MTIAPLSPPAASPASAASPTSAVPAPPGLLPASAAPPTSAVPAPPGLLPASAAPPTSAVPAPPGLLPASAAPPTSAVPAPPGLLPASAAPPALTSSASASTASASTFTSAPAPAPRAADPAGHGHRYAVRLARDEDEVRAAQRLRHQVFAGELGARLDGPEPGLDCDAFDAYCDHLIVVDEETGQVVGTYRLLPPERAAVAGRLYSEAEFDLSALAPIRPDLVEVGRSCVHPDHRNGAVIALIWAGLARYMDRSGHNWLAGCCSIPLADGGVLAAATRENVLARSLAPAQYRVTPHLPWSPEGIAVPGRTELPPLLRGYLRLGAWVCGEPALDAEFGCADLYVLLSLRRTNPRYLGHFLALAPAA